MSPPALAPSRFPPPLQPVKQLSKSLKLRNGGIKNARILTEAGKSDESGQSQYFKL
ncbi:MAG: hypothetical protein ACFE9C_14520 [Candidatus Hodarchaeota archaeon]